MSNARATKRIERRLADHRMVLGKSKMAFDFSHLLMRKAMADPTLHAFFTLAQNAGSLGRIHGQLAVVGLFDPAGAAAAAAHLGIPRGDPWVDVATAVDYFACSARMEIKAFCTRYAPDRARFTHAICRQLSRTTLLLAHFVSIDDAKRERQMWDLLPQPLAAATDDRIAQWWAERRFEPAFVSLYASARKLKFPIDLPAGDLDALGVYGPVLTHWDDDRWLADALARTCDYHLKQMFGLDEDYDSEFDEPPLDLIPAELFALIHLRAETVGPLTTLPDHPLLTCIGPACAAPARAEVTEMIHAMDDKLRAFYRS